VTPGGPFLLCDTINGLPIPLTATMQAGYGATSQIDWYWNSNLVSSGGAGNVTYPAAHTGNYYATVSNSYGCRAKTPTVGIGYYCAPTACTFSTPPTLTLSGSLTDCGEV